MLLVIRYTERLIYNNISIWVGKLKKDICENGNVNLIILKIHFLFLQCLKGVTILSLDNYDKHNGRNKSF